MRLMQTKHGLVALQPWRDYVGSGLTQGSMQEISKKTGAKIVLLIADEQDVDALTVEFIETQVEAIINAQPAEEKA